MKVLFTATLPGMALGLMVGAAYAAGGNTSGGSPALTGSNFTGCDDLKGAQVAEYRLLPDDNRDAVIPVGAKVKDTVTNTQVDTFRFAPARRPRRVVPDASPPRDNAIDPAKPKTTEDGLYKLYDSDSRLEVLAPTSDDGRIGTRAGTDPVEPKTTQDGLYKRYDGDHQPTVMPTPYGGRIDTRAATSTTTTTTTSPSGGGSYPPGNGR